MLCNQHVRQEHCCRPHPGVEAEQTDASGVDDVSDRVGAGAIQVLLVFPRLDELSSRQVGLEGGSTHKMVLAPVPLVYPRAPGCV